MQRFEWSGQNIAAAPGRLGQNLAASLIIFERVARSDLYRLLFSGEIGIAVELIITFAGTENIEASHIAEAIQYRRLDQRI